jgi:hypothetical protein
VLGWKAGEIILNLNIEFIPLNGWLVWFRKHALLSNRTMSCESKSIIEE